MKNRRSIRIASIVIAVMLLAGMVTAFNVSAYYGCEDDFNYTRSDGEIEITDVLTKEADVVIPEEIGGYPVTEISDLAFLGCDTVVNLTIPHTVYEIGDRAFSACGSLENINVSEYNQFYCSVDGVLFDKAMTELLQYPGAKQGTDYTVPEGVVEIEETAFRSCELSQITLPASVKEIDYGAFEISEKLESVIIPEGVEKIDMEAFFCCTALKEIHIPVSVKSIHNTAFSLCTALERINVAKDSNTYTDADGVLFHKNAPLLVKYPAGKAQTEYSLPEECTQIGDWAFSECYSLEKVVLHENVRSIGESAFWDCNSLKSISVPRGVTWIQDSVFYNCNALADVFYSGSESEWNDVEIEWGNECLDNATIHFEDKPAVPTEPAVPSVTYVVGDATSDGKVNVRDATMIQKAAASLAVLSDVQTLAADCDGNGQVNVRDATAIQKFAASIATGIPFGEERMA